MAGSFALALALGAGACLDEPPPLPPPVPVAAVVRPDEHHLSDIVQLTFSGDNSLAHFAWSGKDVVLQARRGPQGCANVERVDPLTSAHTMTAVTAGGDPSFAPGDGDVVFAKPPQCGIRPVGPKGLWLDPGVDIYRARADGSGVTRLTETPGYDGEPAVCGKDGSIVFTSMRGGDLDLYRMDADGSNVRQLTATPGYDGAAAFDADCSHIVWLATRPVGQPLDAYKKQLDDKIFHPDATDLWVANADGSDARQITYLDALSATPVWIPRAENGGRVVFASSYGQDNPANVDLWAVDVNGAALERVTTAPGFDGAPAFSPDGRLVAFTSARATLLGRPDLNVFLARWGGAARFVEERPAEHLLGDSAWLADPAREGRGLGSKGLDDAGLYIERSFKSFGLVPLANDDYHQDFDVRTSVTGQATFAIGGGAFDPSKLRPLGFSSSSAAQGPLVYVGSNDDFSHLDVKGKIVVVKQVGRWSLRHTAWLAHDRGAVGIVVVAEGALPEPTPDVDEGMPAACLAGDVARPLVAMLVQGQHPVAKLAVTLTPETAGAFNVVAKWPASAPPDQRLPGVVVVGAHYDHIGETSPGADDNASGVAALLQIGRSLAEHKTALQRDVVLVAFSGEDEGAAGADAFVKHAPGGLAPKDMVAMINLDMIGRLRDNLVQVFGEDTATQWQDLVTGACMSAHLECKRATSGGFGATDHAAFYEAGVPVVHLFTGVHGDYGKPTDTVDKLNAAGMAQIARAAELLASDVADLGTHLEYQKLLNAIDSDQPQFRVSLGTIPDRAGPPAGQKGMLLAAVRAGGAAEKAGLKKGDVVTRIGGHVVGSVEDVMYVLTDAKPGDVVEVVVHRDGKDMTLQLTLEPVK